MKKKQILIVTYSNCHLDKPVSLYFDNNKPGLAKAITASIALLDKYVDTLPAYQSEATHHLNKNSARYKKLITDLKAAFNKHVDFFNKRMGVTLKLSYDIQA